ncbi:MAG TPA: CHRD domain-containing protein [Steroidobacteraceae bacterium]|nr:CHRD domain-containing protein [Steroidobacteraceae bacterium]
MRNRISRTGVACAVAALLGAGSLMADDGNHDRGHDRGRFMVSGELVGYQEVPALSTTARGRFVAWVDTRANTLTYRLKYDALEGDVTQAHVHFGQHGVNGGISFFLCSNLGNGPAGTQACPAAPGEVSGVITAEQVIGPGPVTTPTPGPGQGIEPGAFEEIAAAIREGVAYANVHSTKWPGGEIRAQLH